MPLSIGRRRHRFVTTSPRNASDDLYRRGLSHYESGEYEDCRACAEQAVAADPKNVANLILKGIALIELDQGAEAIETLERATQVGPTNAEAWRQLGIALMSMGKLNEAVQALR